MRDILLDREIDIKELTQSTEGRVSWIDDPSKLIHPESWKMVEEGIMKEGPLSDQLKYLFFARLINPLAAPYVYDLLDSTVSTYEIRRSAFEVYQRKNTGWDATFPEFTVPVPLAVKFLFPQYSCEDFISDERFSALRGRIALDHRNGTSVSVFWQQLYARVFYPQKAQTVTSLRVKDLHQVDHSIEEVLESTQQHLLGADTLAYRLFLRRVADPYDRNKILDILKDRKKFIEAEADLLQTDPKKWTNLLNFVLQLKFATAKELIVNPERFEIISGGELSSEQGPLLPLVRSYQ